MDIRNYLGRRLRERRRSELGPLEKALLTLRGRRDGAAGLPRTAEDGQWTSPFIQQELNACSEAHSKIFGTLSMTLDEEYVQAVCLSERVDSASGRIAELEGTLPEPPQAAELTLRKRGEENLSDSQVQSRRKREFDKARGHVQAQLRALREQADRDFDQLIRIKGDLDQKEKEAEIVCARILSHTQQRIDYYWNVILRSAKAGAERLPVTFTGLLPSSAVDQYRRLREEETRRIERTINRRTEGKEAA